jgi:type I restriction enzyme, S subunit
MTTAFHHLPLGWKWATIGTVAKELRSGLSRKLSHKDIGLPVLRSTNISEDGIDISDIKYWYRDDPQGSNTENYFLQSGDILVNFINSVSQIGKTAIYRNELGREAIYTTNILRLQTNQQIIPEYFLALTKTQEYDFYIQTITKPAVNQASFTTKEFRKFQFPLPPLPEQRKITEVLCAWDEAIANLGQMITALYEQKKGLMQRLLLVERHHRAPSNRLREFSGEWEKKRIGDIFSRVTRKNSEGNEIVLTASAQLGLVSQLDYYNRSVAGKSLAGYYLIKHGEFAYNRGRSNGYPYGAIKRLERYEEGVLSTLYICFGIKNSANSGDFFKHYFESGVMNLGLYEITQEGARNHGLLNISVSDFFDLTIPVPGLEEQKGLAKLFDLVEERILLVQKKLVALKSQKKSLTQKLLAGELSVKV